MPRPRKPNALTPAERVRASRAKRQVVSSVDLTADAHNALTSIRNRDGDLTIAATLLRLARESLEIKTSATLQESKDAE